MGMNASAILAYGIMVGSECEPPEFLEDFDYDMDSFIVNDTGTKELPYAEQFEAQKKYPVDMVLHGTLDYPEYLLIIRGCKRECDWGDPLLLGQSMPEVAPQALEAFNKWTKEHDIEGEPQWHLCALFG